MGITVVKEAFNRQMSLVTSKLNIELKKKLVIWFRDLDIRKI
jgi:hypothetical protein